jgi:hypothetical protein
MTFLPIVERELRVRARQRATFRNRIIATAGMMGVWLAVFICDWRASTPDLSKELFVTLGILSLGFCMVAGVFLTADCLSSEKREGTLGLLFLTDLSGIDVVLGKFAANSLHAVYALLAVFPILALPLLMGGVTVGEFWRVVLVLCVTIFLSLSLGMLISALVRESREAIGGTLLAMLLLAGFLPALWWIWRGLTRTAAADFLLWPCPAYAYRSALAGYYRTGAAVNEFWHSVQSLFGLGIAFLTAAAFILPRAWQEREARPATRSDPGDLPTGELTLKSSAAWERVRCLESNPFLWLASRDRSAGKLSWIIVGSICAIWAGFLFQTLLNRSIHFAFSFCMISGFAAHAVFKIIVAIEATRQVNADRASGALELILVTPLSESAILNGLGEALTAKFLALRMALIGVNLAMIGAVVTLPTLQMNSEDQGRFFEIFLGGILLLWLDFKTLKVVGLWRALQSPRHARAAAGTIGWVLGIPWAGMVFLFLLLSGRALGRLEPAVVISFFILFGIVLDYILSEKAKSELQCGLRAILSEPREKQRAESRLGRA